MGGGFVGEMFNVENLERCEGEESMEVLGTGVVEEQFTWCNEVGLEFGVD
jgi:hypothetical protein